MTEEVRDFNSIIESEMLTHPVLFTHQNPKNVAIIGDNTQGILTEVLKHSSISSVHHLGQLGKNSILDERIRQYNEQPETWLKNCEASTLDVLIYNNDVEQLIADDLIDFNRVMHSSGLFMYVCHLTLMQIKTLQPIFQTMNKIGFTNVQTLHFPLLQGNRTAILATKKTAFGRIREKDIYNRSFTTHYYNFDTHKAALALPEFLLKELK